MKIALEFITLGKCLLLGLILATLFGVIVYYSPLQETLLSVAGNVIMVLCVFIGAWSLGRHYGSKGLIRGVSFGIAFCMVMLIFSLIFTPSLINISSLALHLLGCSLAGAVGGIVGISLSDKL